MKAAQKIDLGLTGYDDLFTTQAERDEAKQERVVEIPLIEISDFQNHPFTPVQSQSERDSAVPSVSRRRQ